MMQDDANGTGMQIDNVDNVTDNANAANAANAERFYPYIEHLLQQLFCYQLEISFLNFPH